ncbi:Cro/CI family transcriptional regulator [Bordetella avium]|uniref:Phage protein n=1 Tax=Bordetella avium (strain 197N) TaxID=360910 RepID=Q2L2G9_BORA1|nr:Cro/CI family transcriptional regulator [Bordetella avium]AZY48835.1 hypothetical protein C0J09_06545 [Bordetella avium]AZY52215.1 hypothetical protein C0J07_06615 [Bordetella avium]RIQ54484.1 hypothetical protein D0843_02700 [Bordetella avium]RIQ71019.1 hypothetical protein D0838_09845 [Bordetella avium]CAJ49048.1 Putative phage protein [Bordetella avium 197N]
MTTKHPDSDIIDALGGTAAVARLCGVKQPSVSDWRKDGIPRARRMFLQAVRPDAFTDQPAPPPAAKAVEAGHV